MLMPKKTKYRKPHRGNRKGKAVGASTVHYGEYGLMAVEPGWITSRQIEAIRVTINRKLKKIGKLYLRMFPNKAITKKPAETRMGKGKGGPEYWVFVAKRGRILCEVSGIPRELAKQVFQVASCKLPIKTKIVDRTHGESDAAGSEVKNEG